MADHYSLVYSCFQGFLAASLLQARTLAKGGFAASTFSSTPGPGAYGAEGAGLHDPEAAAQAAAEHATAVRMLEEWVDWVEMMRCVVVDGESGLMQFARCRLC
jgi:hypothetical protein